MSNISAILWRGQATVQVETWYDRCPMSDVSDLTRQTLGFDRTEPGNKIPV